MTTLIWGNVDATYSLFAVADPLFYDKPHRRVQPEDALTPAQEGSWDAWVRDADPTWSFWNPPGVTLPEQGWKIHVSATLESADEALQAVSLYCYRNTLPFKFLRSRKVLRATLSKDGDRLASGKFITIYPLASADLHTHLTELDAVLGGLPGPYVLTDVRWNRGPVYVRYGAFVPQFVTENGVDVPAIRDLDTGAMVPDVRATFFHVPPWVNMPHFLRDQLTQLDMTPPDGFPRIRGSLQFSNAGGVYEADLDGRPVILKEARPNVGWTPDGRDAVQRLHDETALLSELSGEVPVPAPLATFTAHGHAFLAMERIDGRSLNTVVAGRNPLSRFQSTPDSRRDYREWVARVSTSLRESVRALHAAGRTHGDLHPGNVLVRDDDTVVLVDLEMSVAVTDGTPAGMGVPGFVATDGRNAADRDLYAAACIELFMFLPLVALLPLDAAKGRELVEEAAAQFGLGATWAQNKLAVMAAKSAPVGDTQRQPTPSRSVPSVIQTILADATPHRRDRLWPGDPSQFSEPPTSLAHGALGVLAALQHAGAAPTAEHLRWVERAEHDQTWDARLGLFDGLAGSVWAYRRIGQDDLADRRLLQLSTAPYDRLGSDLYGGLPGIGLTFLAESTGMPRLRDAALRIASVVRERWRGTQPPSRVATGCGGLMRGATGSALFAIRLYEHTGDMPHLRMATDALDYDLHSLRKAPDGSLQLDEGWRLLPYLAHGSAGVGLVLAQVLSHLPDHGRYLEALDGIIRAAMAPFSIQSGLFQGRAGLIQFLLALETAGLGTNATTAAMDRHVADLRLHAVRRGEEVRFVGDGLLRASSDFSTGAAGVLGTLSDYARWRADGRVDRTCLPYSTPVQGVEHRTPRKAVRSTQGGEIHGIPLVPAGA